MPTKDLEQTFVIIKPDALRNSLTGYVLTQLSEFHTGLHFAGLKVVHVSKLLASEHYAEHVGKAFFPPLLEYITGKVHYRDSELLQRVIAIVYQGPDAVKKLRSIAGPTSPQEARDTRPGCIRSLGANVPVKDDKGEVVGQRMDNLIHASATDDEAEREIKLWFRPSDIPPAMRAYPTEVCDSHFYLQDGSLSPTYEPGSVCVMAPGEVAWESDLDSLRLLIKGEDAPVPLNSVVAKYLL